MCFQFHLRVLELNAYESRVEGFIHWPLKFSQQMPGRAGHDGDVVAMCSGSRSTQKAFPQVDLNSTTR